MSKPFRPYPDGTKKITVGSSSANVLIGDSPSVIRVCNLGTAPVWVAFGSDNSIAADAATDVPIPAGEAELFTLPYPVSGKLYMAAIAAGATGDVYFTPGEVVG